MRQQKGMLRPSQVDEAKAKINTTTLDARLAVIEAALKAKGL